MIQISSNLILVAYLRNVTTSIAVTILLYRIWEIDFFKYSFGIHPDFRVRKAESHQFCKF